MSYIVKHKNSKVQSTKNGTIWVIDGEGLNWTKEIAEKHVLNCEFAAHKIPFEVVEDMGNSGAVKKQGGTFGREGSTKE